MTTLTMWSFCRGVHLYLHLQKKIKNKQEKNYFEDFLC